MTKQVRFTHTTWQRRTQWRWTLDADNHEPLSMSSEGYNNVADAIHGFELSTGSVIEPSNRRVAVRVATVRVESTVTKADTRVPVEVTTQVAEAIDVLGLNDD